MMKQSETTPIFSFNRSISIGMNKVDINVLSVRCQPEQMIVLFHGCSHQAKLSQDPLGAAACWSQMHRCSMPYAVLGCS